VANIDAWLRKIEQEILDPVRDDSVRVEFRQIGKDATLGALEAEPRDPQEIGVLTIVTADSQERATEVAKLLNPALLHMPLTADEPMPTFAFPFSPAEIERGPLYEFCLNHVLELDDPMQAFRLDVLEV